MHRGKRISEAARRRAHAETRRAVIEALGMDPEPTYDERERGVSPAERQRRAGQMYAATTGDLLRDLRRARPELAERIEQAEHEALGR